MRRLFPLIALAMIFNISAFAGARDLPRRSDLICGTLENGLTYYIYPHSYPKGEAVYRLFVMTGSLNETDRQRGLAHFLEHIAFNGTRNFHGNSLVTYLERNGGKFGTDLNAYTTFDETVFKLQMPSTDRAKVDTTMTILSDWAQGMSIDSLEVEKERGVILSERLQRLSPEQKSNEKFINEIFNGSRYSERLTIGDTAIIRNCSANDLKDYYRAWYRPGSMAVAVVGDVDPDFILAGIKSKFGKIESHNRPKAKHFPIHRYDKNECEVYYDPALKDATLDILYLCKPLKSVSCNDDYRSYLEQTVINRLFRQRFTNLAFHNPAYQEAGIQKGNILNATGLIDGSVTLAAGKARQGIVDFIVQNAQIFDYGFTDLEIQQVKRSIIRSFRNKLSSKGSVPSSKLMDEIHEDFYSGNKFISDSLEFSLVNDYLPKMDSTDIVGILHKMTRRVKRHMLLRAPETFRSEIGSDEDLCNIIAQAEKKPQDRYSLDFDVPAELCKTPKAGKIVREEHLDQIGATDWRLSNGARVIFKHSDTEKGRISFSGFRKGGLYSLDSLDYYSGIFAGSIIPISGAGDFTREALNYYLADNSASVRFLVDKTRTGIFGTSSKEDTDTLFRLLYMKWTRPRLDMDVCKQVIDKSCENYKNEKHTPEEDFGRDLGYLLNGRNYTNVELSDTLIKEKIDADKMIPIFNSMYGKVDGYTFIIIGDMEENEIRPFVEKYIAALPEGKTDNTMKYKGRTIPKENVIFERRTSDADKATVSIIFQNENKPQETMNVIDLEGSIVSSIIRTELLNTLREELGKVYSVSVSSGAGKYPSFLSRTTIAFQCKPSDAADLIQVTNRKLLEMANNPSIIVDNLSQVKANLLKEHKINLQKNSFYTTLIRNSIFNEEEDWNFLIDYDELVNGMTASYISGRIKQLINYQRVDAILYPKGH